MNLLKSEVRYCNSNVRVRIKVNRPILPILMLKLIVMATYFERSEIEVQIRNKYLPHGKNLVKIGQVDPKIICLKRFVLKMRGARRQPA